MTRRHTAIAEIADFNPPTPRNFSGSDEHAAFVPMAAVSEMGSISVTDYKSASELNNGFSYFQSGDVLVAKITPCFENNKIAVAEIDRTHGFGSTEFHVIRPRKPVLDSRYLAHFLRQDSVRDAGKKRMTGSAGQRRVPRQFLEELKIPLPPLDEQLRIAAILDQADALRRQRREALLIHSRLPSSVFVELFGDPVANPKGWPDDERLGDIAQIVSGITKGRRLNGAATREIPYLAVINVQDRALNLNVVKTIEATEDEIAKYALRQDDLVLTEGGDPDKLGRGTLWKNEIEECIHQNHIFRARIRSERFLPIFVNWLIGSERGKQYFLRSAKQTSLLLT